MKKIMISLSFDHEVNEEFNLYDFLHIAASKAGFKFYKAIGLPQIVFKTLAEKVNGAKIQFYFAVTPSGALEVGTYEKETGKTDLKQVIKVTNALVTEQFAKRLIMEMATQRKCNLNMIEQELKKLFK